MKLDLRRTRQHQDLVRRSSCQPERGATGTRADRPRGGIGAQQSGGQNAPTRAAQGHHGDGAAAGRGELQHLDAVGRHAQASAPAAPRPGELDQR